MPITIKPTQLKYKDPSTSQYVSVVAAANGNDSSSVDVQINGTSILSNGVANIPIATNQVFGAVKTGQFGVGISNNGNLMINRAQINDIKAGTNQYLPIVPDYQHRSTFYGLAKAAGDSTQSASSNAVGVYTDNAKTAIQNMLSIPSNNNPVFTGSFSQNRKADTTVGENSVAVGENVVASGTASHAEGSYTSATGGYSHAEGIATFAIGLYSHAEGYNSSAEGASGHSEGRQTHADGENSHAEGEYTRAYGDCSHAEGYYTTAENENSHSEGSNTNAFGRLSHAEGYFTEAHGNASHVEGLDTYAAGEYSHVFGCLNVYDSYDSWPEWVANTEYKLGDRVKVEEDETWVGYVCIEPNSDSEFSYQKWEYRGETMNYVEVVGNGSIDYETRSNARTLDWDGNERLKGDLYVNCNIDSTGGTKVAKITDVPDVQINGTSIVSSGVANIPLASSNAPGVAKIRAGYGINISSGELFINKAVISNIKAGTNTFLPIVSYNQHEAVFYGLAKAAGDSTQSASDNAVGTYTDSAKTAIKTMLDIPTLVSQLTNDSGFLTSVPTMTGATSSTAGASGLVPAPTTGDVDKFLAGDGTYKSGGLPMVILSYGNSTWADFEAAYNNNVIVYCRASSNANPKTGSQTRMAFMAYVNNETTPTNVEFQYYRSMSSHSGTQMGDQVYVYKLDKTSGWSVTVREAGLKEIEFDASTGLKATWSNNKLTITTI